MKNKLIILSEFGSHVYGTNLPTSDTDLKGVCLPFADEILLQRVPKVFQEKTKVDETQKNTATDIDKEIFGLQRYIGLLLDGQTPALDLLFTPEKHHLVQSKLWSEIYNNRSKFLHSGVSAFIGYCKMQAQKYGLKGGRVAAFRLMLDFLAPFENYYKLEHPLVLQKLFELVYKNPNLPALGFKHEHISIVEIPNSSKTGMSLALKVAGALFHLTTSVKLVRDHFQKKFDDFGQRALLAEKNQGVDLKATMHAVRVAKEAEELLLTGHITFPRPEKDLLLQIRKGEMPYKEVELLIEQGMDKMTYLQEHSVLPKEPDRKWADEFIKSVHKGIVNEN